MLEWTELCALEPKLIGVQMYAKALGVDPSYQHYTLVKERLRPLVGKDASNEALRTPEAWMTAFGHLTKFVCP